MLPVARAVAAARLRQRIRDLTQRFVDDLLRAVLEAPLAELASSDAGAPRGRPERSARRSAGEIRRLQDAAIHALRSADGPLGAPEIADLVGVRTADLAFPLRRLRDEGRIVIRGERAKATYGLAERDLADPGSSSKKRGR